MRKQESVLRNETNKILWDFEIQTDHKIPAEKSDLVIVNKKKDLPTNGFSVPADDRVKINENEKRDTFLDFNTRLKEQ